MNKINYLQEETIKRGNVELDNHVLSVEAKFINEVFYSMTAQLYTKPSSEQETQVHIGTIEDRDGRIIISLPNTIDAAPLIASFADIKQGIIADEAGDPEAE